MGDGVGVSWDIYIDLSHSDIKMDSQIITTVTNSFTGLNQSINQYYKILLCITIKSKGSHI